MHLVFLNQYYPPDAAPTGVMLEAVVDQLVEQGHEVTVICADGGYAGGRVNIEHRTLDVEHRSEEVCGYVSATTAGTPERSTLNSQHFLPHGMNESRDESRGPCLLGDSSNSQPSTINPQLSTSSSIIRLSASRFGRGSFVGKLADYASYYLGAAWKLLVMHPRPDRIVALTTPPYLSVLARLVSKLRGADHAHWVMDLYPDVMVAHGMLAEGGWKHRLLAMLARWGFGGERCVAIVTLGPDMAERVGRLNIEHGTLNIERRSEEGGAKNRSEENCRGASGTVADALNSIQNPKSKIQNHQSLIHWVPLWGSEGRRAVGACSGVSATVADFSSGREGEGDEDRSAVGGWQLAVNETPDATIQNPSSTSSQPSTAPLSRLTAMRESAAVADAPLQVASALRAKRGWRADELVVMYSGNMGLGHRFGEFLEAAKRWNIEHRTSNIELRSEEDCRGDSVTGGVSSSPSRNQQSKSNNHQSSISPSASSHRPSTINSQLPPNIRFVFYGAGKRRGEIEDFIREHPDRRVELHDYAPAEELDEHLRSADVHLASLDAAWTGTMVPSKLQGIFAVGRPVIFVGSRESSIGTWVAESGGGWVVAPEDIDGLLAALDEAGDPEIRNMRGNAAGEFAKLHFDRNTNASRVAEMFAR